MSFSFEFIAKTEDVPALLDAEHHGKYTPPCILEFVKQALQGVDTGTVHVKAFGHLWQSGNDYRLSNCVIEVKPIELAKP